MKATSVTLRLPSAAAALTSNTYSSPGFMNPSGTTNEVAAPIQVDGEQPLRPDLLELQVDESRARDGVPSQCRTGLGDPSASPSFGLTPFGIGALRAFPWVLRDARGPRIALVIPDLAYGPRIGKAQLFEGHEGRLARSPNPVPKRSSEVKHVLEHPRLPPKSRDWAIQLEGKQPTMRPPSTNSCACGQDQGRPTRRLKHACCSQTALMRCRLRCSAMRERTPHHSAMQRPRPRLDETTARGLRVVSSRSRHSFDRTANDDAGSGLLRVAALGVAVLAALYWLSVGVASGRALDLSGFGRQILAANMPSLHEAVATVLETVNVASLALVGAVVVWIGYTRRGAAGALAVGGAILGASISAETLKVVLGRIDILGWETLRRHVGTFPSGHATVAAVVVLTGLLVCSPRYRVALAVIGSAYTTLVAVGVVLLAWHFPSDALGGIVVAATWASFAGGLLRRFEARGSSRPARRWLRNPGEGHGRAPADRMRSAPS